MVYIGIIGIPYRPKKLGTIVLSSVTAAAVAAVIYFWGDDYTVMTRYFVLIVYIISIISFSDTIWKKLLLFLPVYCAVCILDMAVFGILKMVTDYQDSYVGQISEMLIVNFISLLILFSVSLAVSRFGRDRQRFTWKNYMFASAAIVISAFFIAYSNYVLLRIDSQVNTFMNVVFCAVWVLLILIIFIYINVSWKKEAYRIRLENSERLMEQQKKYYEMLLNKDEDMKRFRHDYQNHLSIVYDYITNEECENAIEYLQEIIHKAGNLKAYKTGNSLIDIILNDIVEKHKNRGITLQIKGKFVERDNISSYDICTIFYNVIENAFEASGKVEQGERFVSVNISSQNNRWLVEIQNSTQSEVVITDNQIVTTKNDKEHHGMGIKNMEQSIRNNGGMLHLEWKHNIFITRIIV